MNLKNSSIKELSNDELVTIEGGDVDGLMRGNGPSWDNFTTNTGYVAGFFVGIFRSLF